MRVATALAHPEWLTATVLGLLCALAVLAAARWQAGRRLRLLLGRGAPRPGLAADLLPAVALLAIGLALLGPRVGTRTVRVPASGVDVVVLFDVSRSMDATDVAPSRIARARRTADAVLAGLGPGDRAALAAFAGHGVILTPLTSDHAALRELLPAVDSDLMTDTGSRIGQGLAVALRAYDPAGLRPRELLVLTDGEGSGSAPSQVLDRLAAAGVRVVAVGIGSETGSTIPTPIGALRDLLGEPVVTRRQMAGLERIARATGGVARAADRFGNVDARALLADLHRDARPVATDILERRVPVSRYALPAALALLLLLAEGLAGRRSGPRTAALRAGSRPEARRVPSAVALASLLLVMLGASPGTAPSAAPITSPEQAVLQRPDDVRALLTLGVAQARAGDRQEARRSFLAALVQARQPGDAALAYYDLGVAALEDERLPEARDAFLDALAVDPADRQARWNLEWTLRALERQPPPGGGGRPPASSPPPRPEAHRATSPGGPSPRKPEKKKTAPDTAAPYGGAWGRLPAQGAGSGVAGAPLHLDREAAEHWLDAVRDDAGRAFQAAAQAGGGAPPPRSGPRW